MTAAAFAHDAFLIERDAAGRCRIRALGADGAPGAPVAVAGPGPATGPVAFRIGPRRPTEVGVEYDVLGPGGERIASLEHRTVPTLVRAVWGIFDGAEGFLVAWLREDRIRTALERRLRDRLAPWRPSRTTGSFTLHSGQRPIGRIRPTGPRLRDRVLDVSGDRERTVDRRAALALAVALDAYGRR